jgi:hypothetical protein
MAIAAVILEERPAGVKPNRRFDPRSSYIFILDPETPSQDPERD